MVITVDIYKEIRQRRLKGESQRGIARALGISRNTVKKYMEGERLPGERIERPREASVLTPEVTAFIEACLRSDEESPGKQHHTAKRIYDRLVEETGFSGGETTVRAYVHMAKEKHGRRSCPWPLRLGRRCRSTGARPRAGWMA